MTQSWPSLLLIVAGALKTLGANKDSPIPIQLFDISDVVLLDSATETVRGHRGGRPDSVLRIQGQWQVWLLPSLRGTAACHACPAQPAAHRMLACGTSKRC